MFKGVKLWARQNRAQFVKIYSDTTHQNTQYFYYPTPLSTVRITRETSTNKSRDIRTVSFLGPAGCSTIANPQLKVTEVSSRPSNVNAYGTSFFPRPIRRWNLLPSDMVMDTTCTLQAFRTAALPAVTSLQALGHLRRL